MVPLALTFYNISILLQLLISSLLIFGKNLFKSRSDINLLVSSKSFLDFFSKKYFNAYEITCTYNGLHSISELLQNSDYKTSYISIDLIQYQT